MDLPGRPSIGRSWSLVAIATAALVLSVSAPDARAGCHAPDRPILARTTATTGDENSWSAVDPDPALVPAAPAALRKLPCGGETPAQAGRDAPPTPAVAPTGPPPEPSSNAALKRPADVPLTPRFAVGRLDRPPRAA